MPELSRFFGIIIRMFAEPGAPHHRAHFHAYYQDEVGIHRVRFFDIVANYTSRVRFEDGVERIIDFLPVLAGDLFGPLRDLRVFNQVRIDPEVSTLVWPNGADFDPATLHDWPENEAAFRELARGWQRIKA